MKKHKRSSNWQHGTPFEKHRWHDETSWGENANMRLIQAKRASEVLSVSLARLYELARLGIIPVVRLGPRQIRFDEDALTEWVRQGGWAQGNGAIHANDAARSGSSAAS